MRKKGFTLTEILIALAIVGVLSAVAINTLRTRDMSEEYTAKRDKAVMNIQGSIREAMFNDSRMELASYDDVKDNVIKRLSFKQDGDEITMRDGTVFTVNTTDEDIDMDFYIAKVVIDVNGSALPNNDGVDKYTYKLDKNGNLMPVDIATGGVILAGGDATTSGSIAPNAIPGITPLPPPVDDDNSGNTEDSGGDVGDGSQGDVGGGAEDDIGSGSEDNSGSDSDGDVGSGSEGNVGNDNNGGGGSGSEDNGDGGSGNSGGGGSDDNIGDGDNGGINDGQEFPEYESTYSSGTANNTILYVDIFQNETTGKFDIMLHGFLWQKYLGLQKDSEIQIIVEGTNSDNEYFCFSEFLNIVDINSVDYEVESDFFSSSHRNGSWTRTHDLERNCDYKLYIIMDGNMLISGNNNKSVTHIFNLKDGQIYDATKWGGGIKYTASNSGAPDFPSLEDAQNLPKHIKDLIEL